MNDQRTLYAFFSAALIFAAGGCSSADDPGVPVSGQVTLDGQPLPGGTIDFLPTDGQGASAGAQIVDGAYEAHVPPGAKQVTIVAQREDTDGKASADPHAGPRMEQYLPARYNSRTELKAEIPEGGADGISFELTSGASK